MVLTKADIKVLNELMRVNIEKMYKNMMKVNLPNNITYDQLSKDIIKISGDEYQRELKIVRLE
ncbi:hypothetical protein GYA44_00205 [Candidatus Microgenomates bacterium]|jgi:hypothetical protein|nr:hypothetical protein [Candidatus Microgenomates bacterium]